MQFEVTEQSREAVKAWVAKANLSQKDWLFPSRNGREKHLTTRQYARLVGEWIAGIGLPVNEYGTHSMRRTKASLIYRKTGNLRAVQLLLGHSKMDSTVRYLGIDVDDALEIAENVDI